MASELTCSANDRRVMRIMLDTNGKCGQGVRSSGFFYIIKCIRTFFVQLNFYSYDVSRDSRFKSGSLI